MPASLHAVRKVEPRGVTWGREVSTPQTHGTGSSGNWSPSGCLCRCSPGEARHPPPQEWPCPTLKAAALTVMTYCKGVGITGQQTRNTTHWNGQKKKKEPELSSQHKPVKTKGYFKTENKWKAIGQIKIKRTLDSIFNIKQQLKEKKHDEGSRKILNMKK